MLLHGRHEYLHEESVKWYTFPSWLTHVHSYYVDFVWESGSKLYNICL
jgi:hypothetical protein